MTTLLTCKELLTDTEFLALCEHWKKDNRAPLVLPDWLREKGLWEQAYVAEWAVTTPDRPIWSHAHKSPLTGGPTPLDYEAGIWWWMVTGEEAYADQLKVKDPVARELLAGDNYRTFPEAIVMLLDYYKPEEI